MAVPEKIRQDVPRDIFDKATKIGERISLYEVRLISQTANLGDFKPVEAMATAGQSCELLRNDQEKKILVKANFAFDLRELNVLDNSMLSIRATFLVAYHFEDSLTDEEANVFGSTSAIPTAWPFWRELVYSTLSRMGVAPVTLPTYQLKRGDADAVAKEPHIASAQS